MNDLRRSSAAARRRFVARQAAISSALLAFVALAAPGCGSSGGDPNAQLKLDLSLETTAPCYGARIVLPLRRTGAKLTKPLKADCTIPTELVDAGCEAATDLTKEVLTMDLRGCFVASAEILFNCELRGYAPAALATADCGCGCQDSCPAPPSVCITREGRNPCGIQSPDALLAEPGRPAATSVSSAISDIVVTTSTTMTNGTLCDVGVEFEALLDDAVTLSEIEIDIDISDPAPQCPVFDGCQILVQADGPGFVRENNETIEICISDADGFSGPTALAQCSILSDGSTGTVSVRRALDSELATVTPPPSVSLR